MLKIKRGDPSGQAALEAYTLLVSVATWTTVLRNAQGALHVRGDAPGVLHSMLLFKAKDPVLNAIAGEPAYLVAPMGLDIRAAHVWSERNEICDKLSGMADKGSCDQPELRQATRAKRKQAPNFLLRSLAGE